MTQRVPTSEGTFAVDDAGQGPAILLLHGSGPGASAQGNWTRTATALREDGYRVIAPDVIGFGSSERPAEFRYGPQQWASSLVALLDALEVDVSHVVGNSMGGRIALVMASTYPDRVSSVTAMGVRSHIAELSEGLRAVRNYDGSREGLKALFENYFVVDRTVVTEAVVDERFAAASAPGEAEHYRAMFATPGANELGLTTEQLAAITQPVLVLHGREDRVIPAGDALTLAMSIPNCLCTIVPRCGHWVQIEQPQTFLDHLRLFLAHG